MRNIILVLILSNLMFSCQNKVNSDVKDWEQQMGKVISSYDTMAQLDHSKIMVEGDQEVEYSIFKKDSKGLYKIAGEPKAEGVFPLKIVYYIKGDKVIKTNFKGWIPYIHKGQKKKGDKCCAMLQELVYLKSNFEVVRFKKKLDLMSSEEFESRKEEFALLDFVKSKVENPQEEYEQTMKIFQELKEKLKL